MSERFNYDMDKINKSILENTYMDSIIDKVIIERNKSVDNAVIMEIQKIAVEGGIETKFTLNERNILNALKKQIPKEHHHTRVREVTDKVRESVCPSCLLIIVTGEEQYPKHCTWCGQAIDWSK